MLLFWLLLLALPLPRPERPPGRCWPPPILGGGWPAAWHCSREGRCSRVVRGWWTGRKAPSLRHEGNLGQLMSARLVTAGIGGGAGSVTHTQAFGAAGNRSGAHLVGGARQRLVGKCVAVTGFRSMVSLYRVPIRGLLSTQSQEEAQRAASKNLDRCVDETVQCLLCECSQMQRVGNCGATPLRSGLLDCILAGALMALLRAALWELHRQG